MRHLGPRQRAILSRLASGDWVKGRALADDVGVLATLIFHYVERLRARGYEIEGDQQRGYRLIENEAARAA